MASDDSPPESAPADPVAPPSGPVQHTDNSPAAAQPAHDPRQPQNIAAESDGGTGSGTALAAEFFAPVEMQHGQEEVAPQGPNGEPGAAVPGAASANADPSPPRTSAFFPVDQITACDGLEPIFLTTQTQELFALVGGRDVTRENPYKAIPKADILSDMLTRLAISDFTPLKQKITDYSGDEFLLVYDADFKFGQNFLMPVTQAALESITQPLMEMHEMPPELVSAPVRKEWVSLGSEAEIESMQVKPTRDLIHIKFTRKRREFGAPCKFDDRDAGQEVSVECRPYRDANYGLTKMELDVAIQALPVMVDTGVQTTWNRSVNFGVQYEPISYLAQECQARMASQEMKRFVNEVSVRFEQALQQNEIMDLFSDEYKLLGEEDVAVGQGAHTVLQEYQSFTDLRHSKDRSISAVRWHPNIKGIVAISCTQRMTLDERIELGSNVNTKSSLILVWSFHDPIHPQLILEAPDDINAFEFNPGNPNLIVGGCVNGEVIMWDIKEFQDKLKSNKKASKPSFTEAGKENPVAVDDRERGIETPFVKYITVSSIEASHKMAISDVRWLAKSMEVHYTGDIADTQDEEYHQLVTTSLDGQVFFWDTRYKKDIKALDLVWKPFLKVLLSSMDNTFDYGCTRISIRRNNDPPREPSPATPSQKQPPKPQPNTKFYCATEEGDLVYADWVADKTEEKASRVEHVLSSAFGPIMDLGRSPFFPEIVLSVGGWAFHVWKERMTTGPLLSNVHSSTYLTAGCWSPTRPGVLYIARADGAVEVWDILDRSHVPSTVQNIASTGISSLAIRHYQAKGRKYQQFLAAGDDEGTLHILEVPRNLAKPAKNETIFVKAFFDREVRRLEYSQERRVIREKTKQAESPAAAGGEAKKEEAEPPLPPPPAAPPSGAAPGEDIQMILGSPEEQATEKEFLALQSRLLEAFA